MMLGPAPDLPLLTAACSGTQEEDLARSTGAMMGGWGGRAAAQVQKLDHQSHEKVTALLLRLLCAR